MKLALFVGFFLLFCPNAFTQSITPELKTSSGGSGSVNGISIQYSIGEPLVNTKTGSSTQITEGFQQPERSTAESVPEFEIKADIYPNPFTDRITINWGSAHTGCTYRIYASNGTLIKEIYDTSKSFSIELSELATGFYHLEMVMPNQRNYFKLIKY